MLNISSENLTKLKGIIDVVIKEVPKDVKIDDMIIAELIDKSSNLKEILKSSLSTVIKNKSITIEDYDSIDIINSNDIIKNFMRVYIDLEGIDVIESEEINDEEINIEDISNEEIEKSVEEASSLVSASDPAKQYLKLIGKIPLLTPNEEIELFNKYNETHDKAVKDKLIESNLKLVVSIAKRYVGVMKNCDLMDLIQEGNIGLIKGIEKFDVNRGYKLSTYATNWIKQRITRYINEKARIIRIPVNMSEKFRKIQVAIAEYVQTHEGRVPDDKEISKITGYRMSDINAYKAYEDAISLDEPISEEEHGEQSTIGDFVPDTTQRTDLAGEKELLKIALKDALDSLDDERQRKILILRYGIEDGRIRTLEEVGEIFGCTRERIRQIEAKALKKMRHPTRSKKINGFLD